MFVAFVYLVHIPKIHKNRERSTASCCLRSPFEVISQQCVSTVVCEYPMVLLHTFVSFLLIEFLIRFPRKTGCDNWQVKFHNYGFIVIVLWLNFAGGFMSFLIIFDISLCCLPRLLILAEILNDIKFCFGRVLILTILVRIIKSSVKDPNQTDARCS